MCQRCVPQGGRARLPDVFIADKNDTAKFEGATAGKFALMALAVRRGDGGQLVAIDHVTPAVSNPFVVSSRAVLTHTFCMQRVPAAAGNRLAGQQLQL